MDTTPSAAVALSDALAATTEQVGRSLVSVSGRRWPITGVAQAPDLILTAAHGAEREDGLEVRVEDRRLPAQLVGRDPALDLAVLRVPGAALPPVEWVAPADRKVGSLVLAVSRPRGAVRARLGLLSAVEPGFLTPWGARVDAALQADLSTVPAWPAPL